MSASANELSLAEMRMLVSSAVHMDVTQIALCVITIPKLKCAIQDLLGASSLLGLAQSKAKRGYSSADGASQPNGSLGVASVSDEESLDISAFSEPQTRRIKRDIVFPDQPVYPPTASPPISMAPVTVQVDSILPDGKPGTEFSMVGDKIAIGRPGKSKAKTDKRVRYITCRVCHLLFYKRDQYRDHMRTHANDPNINIYACDHCTFVTKRKGVFQTHVLRHTGALPFKCTLCDYAGRQSSLLKQHMLNKHPDYVEGSPARSKDNQNEVKDDEARQHDMNDALLPISGD